MDWSPFLPAWGGVNLELLTRIDALERAVEQIRSQKASENAFGIAKLTNAQDVTDANSGLALSAMQNNAGIEGTIANRLDFVQRIIGQILCIRKIVEIHVLSRENVAPGEWREITADISAHNFQKIPYAVTRQTGWFSIHSIRVPDLNTMQVTVINPFSSIINDGVTITLIEPM